LQITGRTKDVCSNEPLDEKFRAFGWDVEVINGHDIAALTSSFSPRAQAGSGAPPKAIIANTTKGKGVSFMEDNVKWHHGVPSDEEFTRAITELDAAIGKAEGTLR